MNGNENKNEERPRQTDRIAKEWQSYRKAALTQDATELQLKIVRRAFYAGCLSLLNMQFCVGRDTPEISEEDFEELGVGLLEDVRIELDKFVNGIRAGTE